jgi:hypothetical protein
VNREQVTRLWTGGIPSDALAIGIGDGPPFDSYKDRIHLRNHLVSVGITNRMVRQPATNCELILERITGPLSACCPVKIKTNFVLNAGATEYIPLAEFDERIDRTRPAPSKPGLIMVHFPINQLSDRRSYLDAGSYELTLLATSADTPATRVTCRLILEDGFLSLQLTQGLVPSALEYPD